MSCVSEVRISLIKGAPRRVHRPNPVPFTNASSSQHEASPLDGEDADPLQNYPYVIILVITIRIHLERVRGAKSPI